MSNPSVEGTKAAIVFDQNKFYLSGNLNFSNVNLIYEKSLKELTSLQQLVFDFSEVQSNNSAGLALIIEWRNYAKKNKKEISFIHLPQNLLAIAEIAGIFGYLT